MHSSGEIWILFKVAELAKRCGLRASDVVACFEDESEKPCLSFLIRDVATLPPERIQIFNELLGVEKGHDPRFGELTYTSFGELEDLVENALAKAPRPRQR